MRFLLALALLGAAAPAQTVVMLGDRPVLTLYEVPGRIRLEERARIVEGRLLEFAHSRVPVRSIRVEDDGTASDVLAGDLRLVTATDRDAAQAGKSRAELAASYASAIQAAVEQYRHDYGWRQLTLGALYTAPTTLVLAGAVALLWMFRRRLRRSVVRWSGPESVRAFERYIQRVILNVEVAVRWVLVLILVNIYVPLVLGFFPGTAGMAQVFRAWLLAPVSSLWASLVGYLPSLFFLLVIALVVWGAIRLSDLVFSAAGDGRVEFEGFHPEWAEPTAKLVRVLLVLLGIVAAYPYLPGSDSPAFKGVSVFVGLLLSFGSTSVVSNAVAGTILVYTNAFKSGDRVKVGEHVGDIVERTLFVTRVRTIKNEIVTVPNASVMSGAIVNYSTDAATAGLILHTTVTIGYDAPWAKVHELLIAAALETPGVLTEPKPFVLQTALNDSNVSYQINAYTRRANEMVNLYSELHRRIQDHFNAAGVEIMSPLYHALRDGNTTTMPVEYRPADYSAPGFRIDGTGRGSAASG